MDKTALIILAQGFEEIEAITPIDLLRRAGIKVIVAGLENTRITGRSGILIECDVLLQESLGLHDAIILPGGMPGTTNLTNSSLVETLIQSHSRAGRICAAICAAPTVLAKAGVLCGKKATCYPGNESELKDALFSNVNCIVDHNIITAQSAASSIAFSLAIIAALSGTDKALSVAQAIVYASA